MRYLNSFKPLCQTKQGRAAIDMFDLPPYIDKSCRREPDFESPFPSISAVCRGKNFAPRLKKGDSVIYMTVKGRYGREKERCWRLVANLTVLERFDNHKDASRWYLERDLKVPSNCLIPGNGSVAYEMTGGADLKRFGTFSNTDELLRRWDLSYQRRVRQYGVFLICKASFLDLFDPPILTDNEMLRIFGKIPPTLNPPPITEEQFQILCVVASNHAVR